MHKIKETVIKSTPVFTLVEKQFDNVAFTPVGLNCNDWVMIIIKDNDDYLLVKQTRWGKESQTIEFPCGTVENNEKPMHAALRELEEETGIKVNSLRKIGDFNPNPAYFNNMMHVYLHPVNGLKERFKKHAELHLDPDEDCKPFIGKLEDLSPSAMTYAALYLLKTI